ncbi:MAG: DUF2461 domain-containing protein [Candidatus Thorarchaeota archaeon SMTZ1-83]|nr:MAG: hypothetical protein AM324_08805 [Candidatus Thorarchaeota archaeon SMTZ1-83]
MEGIQAFTGFPKEGLGFLAELKENNYREWFNERKNDYQEYLVKPALSFVVALGKRLTSVSDDMVYDTRTNGSGSLLRIYRDIRFSKDKSPYNTRLRVRFWEGPGKKKERPGFFVGLDETGGGIHGGLWMFPKRLLEKYRKSVLNNELGTRLVEAIDNVKSFKGYEVGGEHYTRVPRGCDANHPRAALLRFNGLYVSSPKIPVGVLKKPELVDVCFDHIQKMMPIHEWLIQLLG